MPLRLYADECVDMRIVAGLRRRGIDVVSVVEQKLLGADDRHHIEEATNVGRVLLSADQDFLRLAHELSEAGEGHPGVIYILPKTRVGVAVRSISVITQLAQPLPDAPA